MPTVAVTDFTFPSLEIEEAVLRPTGAALVHGQCKTVEALIPLVSEADVVLTQFAPVRAEVVAAIKKDSGAEKARQAADADATALGNGSTLDQIAEQRGLTVERPEPMTRGTAFPSLGRSLPLTNALWDAQPGAYTAREVLR